MKPIFKTTLLLGLMTGLFLAVGRLLGGTGGMAIALLMALLFNMGTFFFSDKLVLKMQRAVPLDPKEHPFIERTVRELAEKDRLPMPKLYIVDTPVPNAFATGRSPKHAVVAVTTGILNILDKNELRAVLAHELGHVKNRDMLVSTVAASIGGAISFLAEIAFWTGGIFGGNDEEGNNIFGSLAIMMLAPFAAILIQMAVSRSREYLADQHGAKLSGTPDELANALLKLESFKLGHNIPARPADQAAAHLMFANMFNAGMLHAMFSTHPKTEDRVRRLRNI